VAANHLSTPSGGPPDASDDRGIAVLVLTHNRVDLLRKCVENVLLRTSPATREILIWNNGSTDGTAAYLDSLDDPRIRVVHCETNIGHSGYARASNLTTSPYLVELDDDVVEAPERWDLTLREAFLQLPHVGFLAADLEDDPYDPASRMRHQIRAHEYQPMEENGVRLLSGPAGGGCALTSRELVDRVGGFREERKKIFWLEDQAYITDISRLGYKAAVLADLKVHHTGGPHYTFSSKEKEAFWAGYWKRRARRQAIKRMVFRVPFFRRLNARYAWFQPPS
jgi:GT2 family glycosyltransferase